MRSRLLVTAASWVAALLVGAFYAVAGTVAHSVAWGPVPVGLIVAAVTCLALLIAIRALTHDRGAALSAGLGMIATVVVLSMPGPGGSVLVPDTAAAQIWLWVVIGSAVLVVAWPSVSRFLPPQVPAASDSPTGTDETDRRLDL